MNDADQEHHHAVPMGARRIAVAAAFGIAYFGGGLCAGFLLRRDRFVDRFREFISTGIELGFITVDARKLDEAIAAGFEGEEGELAEERDQGDGR